MTVLNYSETLNFSRSENWRHIFDLANSKKYLNWVNGAERISGKSKKMGGTWRFFVITNTEKWLLDMEVTQWPVEERVALEPVKNSGVHRNIRLFQIAIDLKEKANNYVQINVHCEYEPTYKRTKFKNLIFLRRRYLKLIGQSVDALARLAAAEKWQQDSKPKNG